MGTADVFRLLLLRVTEFSTNSPPQFRQPKIIFMQNRHLLRFCSEFGRENKEEFGIVSDRVETPQQHDTAV